MLPDPILPTPEDDIARILRDYERRLSHLETLEQIGGAWSLIEDIDIAIAQADADFQNIPATFAHLAIVFSARSSRVIGVDSVQAHFNGDVAANYALLQSRTSSVGHAAVAVAVASNLAPADVPGGTATAGTYGGGIIWIPDYRGTSQHKVMLSHMGFAEAYSAGNIHLYDTVSFWKNTVAITRVRFQTSAGANNFVAGSRFTLYGVSV